jgi:hypothetical protein
MTSRPAVRLLILFVLPNVFFLTLIAMIEADDLIKFANMLVVSLAAGVCIAYFPAVQDILVKRPGQKIDRTDLLALGIFCGWFSLVVRSLWAIYWRQIERPELADHPLVAYCIFLTAAGAVFHMLAPGTVASHVPTERWLALGAWGALGIFLALTTSWWVALLFSWVG